MRIRKRAAPISSPRTSSGRGLIAATALLIDYVLTVSVSVAAGVRGGRFHRARIQPRPDRAGRDLHRDRREGLPHRGDRLAFSNGIIVLALFAIALVAIDNQYFTAVAVATFRRAEARFTCWHPSS